jgi:hypothetical protein
VCVSASASRYLVLQYAGLTTLNEHLGCHLQTYTMSATLYIQDPESDLSMCSLGYATLSAHTESYREQCAAHLHEAQRDAWRCAGGCTYCGQDALAVCIIPVVYDVAQNPHIATVRSRQGLCAPQTEPC